MIFYEEILREFQKNKVKYIIVGGVAFNMLGPMRATSDLDILVEMSDKNLEKIVKTLKKFGYYVKQAVDPIGIADKDTRDSWIRDKGMKAFNFYKDNTWKEVDIIIDSPVSFEKAARTSINVKVGTLKLPIISVGNLIKMKKNTGREKDMSDINTLKKFIKKRKRK